MAQWNEVMITQCEKSIERHGEEICHDCLVTMAQNIVIGSWHFHSMLTTIVTALSLEDRAELTRRMAEIQTGQPMAGYIMDNGMVAIFKEVEGVPDTVPEEWKDGGQE